MNLLLKKTFKNAAMAAVRCSGLPWLVRNLYARRKTTILLYHDPAPDILEKHLEYLSKRYAFITLDLLVEALQRQDWSLIPEKSLVVTLDDGHLGNYRLLDIFKKYRVIPTIYLCSRIVGSNRHFWWKDAGKEAAGLKRLPNARRLQLLKDSFDFGIDLEYPARQALDMDELSEMKDFVDFGAHTLYHPVLTACTDDECRTEIAACKRDLERISGKTCRHFSYPNGDYGEREITFAREAGYHSARTIDVGWNDLKTDPFTLKVIGVADDASLTTLIAQLSGLPLYIKYLLQGSRGGKYPVIRCAPDEARPSASPSRS